MSYAVSMSAEDVNCKIPLMDLPILAAKFESITFEHNDVSFEWEWEEDGEPIRGKIIGAEIVLNKTQNGTYKNSSDGGLSYLLTKYKGSGIVTEDGEEGGDTSVTKWVKGKSKEGRIVFDDDEDDEEMPMDGEKFGEDDEDEDPYEHDYEDEDEEYDEETEKEDAKTIQESGILEYIGTLNGILLEEQQRPFKPQIKVEKSGEKKQEKPSKPSRFDNII